MKTGTSKIQPTLLRQLNEQQVIAALQSQGPLSRAEICRHTGVSFPTVTRAVASLIEATLLEETEPVTPSIGRPGKLIRLARSKVSVLGCVINPQVCEVVAATLDGGIVADGVRQFDTPSSYDALLDQLDAHLKQLVQTYQTNLLAVGISVPGLLNRRDGISLFSPNLHQLDGHRLRDDLRQRLQVPAVVVQESHALCMAEQTYGEARGIENFVMLDINKGLGIGVVHRGELLLGHRGLAGELGHITVERNGRLCGCGNRGCLETVATDRALASIVSERTKQEWTVPELVAAIAAGKIDAQRELDDVLEYLSIGAAAAINLFNPQKLFIHGHLFDAQADLFPRLVEQARGHSLQPNYEDCQIVRAKGTKRLGAVAAAIQHVTNTRQWAVQ